MSGSPTARLRKLLVVACAERDRAGQEFEAYEAAAQQFHAAELAWIAAKARAEALQAALELVTA